MENTFEEDYPEYCKEKEPQKPIWIQKYCVWIDGHICDDLHYSVNTNDMDKIGNLFDTKEEAEKAVEKLKAWKRLKDRGFRFVGWRGNNDKHHLDGVAWYEMRLCGGYDIETADDLETIFGPEEKE